jgi:predicted RNase H-like HicB family nuclease
MKYKVIVEKNVDNQYFAYCPETKSLCAWGMDISSCLDGLQKKFYCYLHDPMAELDITFRNDDCLKYARNVKL